MSLIISMKVPDCIVVSSDSCMTMTTTTEKTGTKQVVAMSHTEHTPKMVVFQERLVVTYCDAMRMNPDLTVLQFLQNERQSVPKDITPEQLAKRILTDFKTLSADSRTVFLVSGYVGNTSSIYRVDSDKPDIIPCLKDRFGASYNGETKYVHDMMSSVANYENISPKDAIQLVSTMMDCISTLSKFWESQSVGGDIDIYIMFRDRTLKSGWVRAGQVVPVLPFRFQV